MNARDGQPVAYTQAAAARSLTISGTHAKRLVDDGRLERTDVVVGTGVYVSAESVERYREERS